MWIDDDDEDDAKESQEPLAVEVVAVHIIAEKYMVNVDRRTVTLAKKLITDLIFPEYCNSIIYWIGQTEDPSHGQSHAVAHVVMKAPSKLQIYEQWYTTWCSGGQTHAGNWE